jgi:type I restriction enzyme S subunit
VSGVIDQQVPEGYKLTEVGVIPRDWHVKTIGEVTTDIGDGIHATPEYSSSGEYYFVNGNNISNGSIIVTEGTKKVDESEFQKHKKSLSLRTIFLSINGTIGNLALYDNEPLVLGKSAAYINVKEQYLPIYIYYGLQAKTTSDFFSDGLTGSTIKNLGLGVIRATPIPMPVDQEEQTAIANALSDVDTLITSLEKLITKKRAIKTAAMQQLLTGKKRLPPFDQTQTGYKQTELGEIPEDWEVGIVKGLVENMTSGLSRRLASHDIGLPVLISGNIQNKKLVTDNLKYWYKDDPQGASIEDYVLNDGDILLCFINSMSQIGKPCIFKDIGRPAIYTTNLFRIVISNIHSSEFAYYLFSSAVFQKQIQLISKIAVNQASFTKPDFLHIKIIHPSDKVEQCAIAETLSDLDSEIDGLEQRLIKTQKIKLGMMQELLTGRTRLI